MFKKTEFILGRLFTAPKLTCFSFKPIYLTTKKSRFCPAFWQCPCYSINCLTQKESHTQNLRTQSKCMACFTTSDLQGTGWRLKTVEAEESFKYYIGILTKNFRGTEILNVLKKALSEPKVSLKVIGTFILVCQSQLLKMRCRFLNHIHPSNNFICNGSKEMNKKRNITWETRKLAFI